MIEVAAIRAYLHVESDSPITVYTGKIVKTLLYTLIKELRLYKGLRGIVSPLHISPLFKPGRIEWGLGELVTPRYSRINGVYRLQPVEINGEHIIHLGGIAELIKKAKTLLETLRTPLQIKIGDSIIRVKLEKIEDVTSSIIEKTISSDRITIYLKAPVKLFNIYTASRLPKFNVSAIEVLMTPYMFYRGQLTMNEKLLIEASRILGLLVETYYSLTTVNYIQIPIKEHIKDPGMTGKITYIIDTEKHREHIEHILQIAEITGIGESRINGFGTVSWRSK